MRGYWALPALAAIAIVIVGCGGQGSDTTAASPAASTPARWEVTVTLNGWEGPEIAGMLMAEKLGYFAEAGIKVFNFVPTTAIGSIPDVVGGLRDFGISYQPQVVMDVEKGAPIVAVGSLVPQPTAAMIWLKGSGINRIADLKGKKIAIPDLPFQRAFLQQVLAQSGLSLEDVEIETAGKELVPALAGGQVDAIFGATWSVEGAELEARGLDPVITKVEDLGFPAYEEFVVITSSHLAAKQPQLVRGFMSAIARGTQAALEDPEAAAKVIGEAPGVNPETSQESLLAEVEATLPLLSKTGRMDPGKASALIGWMRKNGMIQKKPPVSELLINSHLRQP